MKKHNWKWAVLGIALVFALVFAGCSNGNDGGPTPLPTEELPDTYDVIIVGAGTSGHAALAGAVDTGAKVIIIEQNETPAPMMSAGIAGAESVEQKLVRDILANPSHSEYANYRYLDTTTNAQTDVFSYFTKDDFFDALVQYSHYTANGPLVRRIVDESAKTLEFLANRGLTTNLQFGSDQGMHWQEQWLQTYHMHNSGWANIRGYATGATTYQDGGGYTGRPVTTETFGTYQGYDDNTNTRTTSNYPVKADRKNATIRTKTRAIDLIVDENKKVIGVLAEDVDDHHPVKIYGKKVILCTGGYGPATAKFKELLELEHLQFYAFGGEGNTGSGIEMAVNTAGAKLWGDHSFMLHNNVARKADGTAGNELAGSALFFLYNWEAIPCVNTEGRRFMNEKLVSNSALWANASYGQGGTYYIVFSKNILDNLEANGITQKMWYIGSVSDPLATYPATITDYSTTPPTVTPHPQAGQRITANESPFTSPTEELVNMYMSFGLMAGAFSVSSGYPVNKDRFNGQSTAAADGNKLKSITAATEEFAEKGWIYKGSTVEELARNAGMSDPSVLVNTIATYNAAVQHAKANLSNPSISTTDEFGKAKEYLTQELTTGPYYLMRLSLSSLGGSSGGIMVDPNLQVLDNNYKAIPGLYAAGLNAGGFYGPVSTYYDYEGSAMMFATNSGRIAGEEAGKAAVAGK